MDFITTLVSILTALVIGACSPWVHEKFSKFANHVRKRRALGRISHEPYYQVGSVINRAYMPGVGDPICQNWYIAEMHVGRILLRSIDDPSEALPMTVIDFETMQVFVDNSRRVDSNGVMIPVPKDQRVK